MSSIIRMLHIKAEGHSHAGLGRNDDCWCGSGRKYKKCHLEDDSKKLGSKVAARCGKT